MLGIPLNLKTQLIRAQLLLQSPTQPTLHPSSVLIYDHYTVGPPSVVSKSCIIPYI
jgi:hypothetical protein